MSIFMCKTSLSNQRDRLKVSMAKNVELKRNDKKHVLSLSIGKRSDFYLTDFLETSF